MPHNQPCRSHKDVILVAAYPPGLRLRCRGREPDPGQSRQLDPQETAVHDLGGSPFAVYCRACMAGRDLAGRVGQHWSNTR
jgi:hypothetical protein